ncbi:hypothetical protein [Sphaerisporangium perillae]|uniref:hypothetical protein n=1 Tax=Sphaerisporangium perillae TaxID=2935860 RepID=UPI00200D4F52|nr:hypothetical protein [Sphaerisporangium perillae]
MTEGHRVLLTCRRRGEALRAKGFTYEQIADVLALDLCDSPLLLHRYAHGLTAAQVVAAFNDLDPAGTASMRTARLYDLEGWPESRRRPSPRVLDLLARIYQTTARRLVTDQTYSTYSSGDRELIDAADHRHLDPCQRIRLSGAMPEISHASMDATAGAWPVKPSVPTPWVRPGDCAALFRALSAEEADVKRRELLFELALTLGGVPALRLLRHLTPDEELRLAQVIQGTSRVDAEAVTAIGKLIAHCWQLDESLGPLRLLPVADAQRDLIARLLRGESLTPALRERLLWAYWAVSHLGGWLHYDVLDHAGAITRYEDGLKVAHQLEDPTLLAHTHGLLAEVAGFQGEHSRALDHAFAAQGWVKSSASPLQHAASALVTARALSHSGKERASLRAIDHAYSIAGKPRSEMDPAYLYWCTPARVQRHSLYCFVTLKRTAEAFTAAEKALVTLDGNWVRQRGFVLVEYATALTRKREIAEAARQLGDVATIATRHSSARLVHGLRAARRDLQPWATNTYVRDLDEKLRGLGLATASAPT